MSTIQLSKNFIRSTCKLALNEDLFPSGDITSELLNKSLVNRALGDEAPDPSEYDCHLPKPVLLPTGWINVPYNCAQVRRTI